MKVNISYAVELEDVPREVGKLLDNLAAHMAVLLNDIEEVGADNPTKATDSISKIRESLADLDLRLSDCSNILAGFMDIQSRIATNTAPDNEEKEDAPTD